MFAPLRLAIYAPETLLDVAEVEFVRLRLADGGPIDIRPGHASLLAETVAGTLCYSQAGNEYALELMVGILWVRPGHVEVHTTGPCGTPGYKSDGMGG